MVAARSALLPDQAENSAEPRMKKGKIESIAR